MTAKQFGAQAFHGHALIHVNAAAEQAFRPKVGHITVVDRWVNGRWEQLELVWDGERYVRQPEQPSVHEQAYDA